MIAVYESFTELTFDRPADGVIRPHRHGSVLQRPDVVLEVVLAHLGIR